MSKRSMIFAFVVLLLCSLPGAALAEALEPSPALSPTDVVRAQLAALRAENRDNGARRAFRFASPANRQTIGSASDFAAVLEQGYADMFSQVRARVKLQQRDGDQARVVAELEQIDGRQSAYVFFLSRQPSGNCEDCWMTDGVYPLESTHDAPMYSI
ncbi:hypothetical protein SADO_07962 [Salinisphaera dokdonensis CL-ES53]|uniref:DUF4864 domain-containing protein n=1 Tax=Salinisphaera dokdonensis CL-ES53 TaxID=1304272 RepID=A0ABV2B0S3_9GAMM